MPENDCHVDSFPLEAGSWFLRKEVSLLPCWKSSQANYNQQANETYNRNKNVLFVEMSLKCLTKYYVRYLHVFFRISNVTFIHVILYSFVNHILKIITTYIKIQSANRNGAFHEWIIQKTRQRSISRFKNFSKCFHIF